MRVVAYYSAKNELCFIYRKSDAHVFKDRRLVGSQNWQFPSDPPYVSNGVGSIHGPAKLIGLTNVFTNVGLVAERDSRSLIIEHKSA